MSFWSTVFATVTGGVILAVILSVFKHKKVKDFFSYQDGYAFVLLVVGLICANLSTHSKFNIDNRFLFLGSGILLTEIAFLLFKKDDLFEKLFLSKQRYIIRFLMYFWLFTWVLGFIISNDKKFSGLEERIKAIEASTNSVEKTEGAL